MINPEAADLITALMNQRNTALHDAAVNWALCVKYERRIAELETELEKLKHDDHT